MPAVHTLVLLSMLVAHGVIVLLAPVWSWLTLPLAAIAMACALSVVHEAAHGTYFPSKQANGWAGRVFALLILMNFSLYRRDHMAHHAFLGTVRDTEETKHIHTRAQLMYRILYNDSAWPHWRESFSTLLHPALRTVRRDAFLLLSVTLGWVAVTLVLPFVGLMMFWLPYTAGLVLDNLISLPEHAVLPGSNPTPVTRTTHTSRWLAFLLYYVNFHDEHHTMPTRTAWAWRRLAGQPYAGYHRFYLDTWRRLGA